LVSFKTLTSNRGYGGYVTAMILGSNQDDKFKCGASVSPITDWLYYSEYYLLYKIESL
jgi:hypothetical protein